MHEVLLQSFQLHDVCLKQDSHILSSEIASWQKVTVEGQFSSQGYAFDASIWCECDTILVDMSTSNLLGHTSATAAVQEALNAF